MMGRYGWQIFDDAPYLISTIKTTCYRVVLLQLIIRHVIHNLFGPFGTPQRSHLT